MQGARVRHVTVEMDRGWWRRRTARQELARPPTGATDDAVRRAVIVRAPLELKDIRAGRERQLRDIGPEQLEDWDVSAAWFGHGCADFPVVLVREAAFRPRFRIRPTNRAAERALVHTHPAVAARVEPHGRPA